MISQAFSPLLILSHLSTFAIALLAFAHPSSAWHVVGPESSYFSQIGGERQSVGFLALPSPSTQTHETDFGRIDKSASLLIDGAPTGAQGEFAANGIEMIFDFSTETEFSFSGVLAAWPDRSFTYSVDITLDGSTQLLASDEVAITVYAFEPFGFHNTYIPSQDFGTTDLMDANAFRFERTMNSASNASETWYSFGFSSDRALTGSATLRIDMSPTPIPEPTTALLLGLGLAGVSLSRKSPQYLPPNTP